MIECPSQKRIPAAAPTGSFCARARLASAPAVLGSAPTVLGSAPTVLARAPVLLAGIVFLLLSGLFAPADAQDVSRLDPALRLGAILAERGATPAAQRQLPGLAVFEQPAGADAVGRYGAGPDAHIRVLVRLAPGDEHVITAAGGEIGARAGDIVTARLPVEALDRLSADPAVGYLEAARALESVDLTGAAGPGPAAGRTRAAARPPEPGGSRITRSSFDIQPGAVLAPAPPPAPALFNDVGIESANAHRLRQLQGGEWTGLDGEDVIVGIYDSGLDLEHQDLRRPDGSTRVLHAWDQTAGEGPAPGSIGDDDFAYGRDCTSADIDAGACPMRDITGHGTHVAGTAAGDGSATGNGMPAFRYPGVAPSADLIVVKGGDDLFTSDRLIEGVAYIFARAEELGRPAVVNISLGTQAGPHDGSTLFEQALDGLVGPGRILVTIAGNQGANANESPAFFRDATHAMGELAPASAGTHNLLVPEYTPNPGVVDDGGALELWYDGEDSLTVVVRTPGGHSVRVATGDTTVTATPDGSIFVDNAFGGPADINGDHGALIVIFDGDDGVVPASGEWQIGVEADAVAASGVYHLWLLGGTFANSDALTALEGGTTNSHLVASPGTASRAVTVGAYTTRHQWPGIDGPQGFPAREPLGDIAFFSSPGPRRDGVLKPELTAPGKMVISSAAEGGTSWEALPWLLEADGEHVALLGTSMAGPHVTGAIALLLQIDPTLTPEAVRDILGGSARVDEFALHPHTGGPDGSPNAQWGHGKLNAEGAVHLFDLPEGGFAGDVRAADQPDPQAGQQISGAAGTRIALLELSFTASEEEAVALDPLAFEIEGADTAAIIQLIRDLDGDGAADAGEPVIARRSVALHGGTPAALSFADADVIPAGTTRDYILLLQTSGAAPNNSIVRARYLPDETHAIGTLSGATLPPEGATVAVSSALWRFTVLQEDEALNLSANPVRGDELVINYESRPESAAIYAVTARRVRSLTGDLTDGRVTWDLRDEAGDDVANGAYFLVLDYGDRHVREKFFVHRGSR